MYVFANQFHKLTFSLVITVFICHPQAIFAQRNSDGSRSGSTSSNYKDALLIYPTGIRSERDLPVCPGWAVEDESSKDEVNPSYSPSTIFGGTDVSKLQQPLSTKNPADSKKEDARYLSACNIIHRRYFQQPMIERLCRCPDRTECPMEWSQPPRYKDLVKDESKGAKDAISTTPSSKSATTFDPYTIMVSSRTQLKFCTEVGANLPLCEKPVKHKDSSLNNDLPSMVKTVKKTNLSPELPSISINCYCPPLYHGWTFLSKNLPNTTNGNTTSANDMDAQYLYKCNRLRRCKTEQQCGTVRTDYHFSYYQCSCPKKHLCLPKVYPPLSTEDVIEEAEEALYSGQVSPAFCTPE